MKQKSNCFSLLIKMIDCIYNFSEKQSYDTFNKSYNQLQNILRKEYFTPFDREDIYMIAVRLDYLCKAVEYNKSVEIIKPLINKIKQIILMFQGSEKNKFRNIFNALSEYHNINTDEIILSVSGNNKKNIINLIEKCNETIIQIEYTILKNS